MNEDSPLPALRCARESLRRLVQDYPAPAFEGRLTTDGWSGRDHLAHIARYQMVFHERVQRIRDESEPPFSRYRGDEDPAFAPYRALPVAALFDRFDREREVLLVAIDGLAQSDLDRRGVHPVYGAITLRRWIDFMIAHEGHHYYQIMRCIAPKG